MQELAPTSPRVSPVLQYLRDRPTLHRGYLKTNINMIHQDNDVYYNHQFNVNARLRNPRKFARYLHSIFTVANNSSISGEGTMLPTCAWNSAKLCLRLSTSVASFCWAGPQPLNRVRTSCEISIQFRTSFCLVHWTAIRVPKRVLLCCAWFVHINGVLFSNVLHQYMAVDKGVLWITH